MDRQGRLEMAKARIKNDLDYHGATVEEVCNQLTEAVCTYVAEEVELMKQEVEAEFEQWNLKEKS